MYGTTDIFLVAHELQLVFCELRMVFFELSYGFQLVFSQLHKVWNWFFAVAHDLQLVFLRLRNWYFASYTRVASDICSVVCRLQLIISRLRTGSNWYFLSCVWVATGTLRVTHSLQLVFIQLHVDCNWYFLSSAWVENDNLRVTNMLQLIFLSCTRIATVLIIFFLVAHGLQLIWISLFALRWKGIKKQNLIENWAEQKSTRSRRRKLTQPFVPTHSRPTKTNENPLPWLCPYRLALAVAQTANQGKEQVNRWSQCHVSTVERSTEI
jgi:hypothetical protein